MEALFFYSICYTVPILSNLDNNDWKKPLSLNGTHITVIFAIVMPYMIKLPSDRAIGGSIFGASIVGIVIYALLMIYAWEITIRVTVFLAVALVLAILAWIGYTMATTPPPEPITEQIQTEPQAEEKKEEKKTQ